MAVVGRRGAVGGANGTLDAHARAAGSGAHEPSQGDFQSGSDLAAQLARMADALDGLHRRLDADQAQREEPPGTAMVAHSDNGALARAQTNLARAEGLQQGLLFALEREREMRGVYEQHVARLEEREERLMTWMERREERLLGWMEQREARMDQREARRDQFLIGALEQLESQTGSMFEAMRADHNRQLDQMQHHMDRLAREATTSNEMARDLAKRRPRGLGIFW